MSSNVQMPAVERYSRGGAMSMRISSGSPRGPRRAARGTPRRARRRPSSPAARAPRGRSCRRSGSRCGSWRRSVSVAPASTAGTPADAERRVGGPQHDRRVAGRRRAAGDPDDARRVRRRAAGGGRLGRRRLARRRSASATGAVTIAGAVRSSVGGAASCGRVPMTFVCASSADCDARALGDRLGRRAGDRHRGDERRRRPAEVLAAVGAEVAAGLVLQAAAAAGRLLAHGSGSPFSSSERRLELGRRQAVVVRDGGRLDGLELAALLAHAQLVVRVDRLPALDAARDRHLHLGRQRLIAVDVEQRGRRGRRRRVDVGADDDAAVVLDAQRDRREEQRSASSQPGARAALAAERAGLADGLAARRGGQALDLVDAEPGRQAGERVLGREVDVEVRGQRVERRDDRVEHLLERVQEAHRERRRLVAAARRRRGGRCRARRCADGGARTPSRARACLRQRGRRAAVGRELVAASGSPTSYVPRMVAFTMCTPEAIVSSGSSTMCEPGGSGCWRPLTRSAR